MIEVGKRPDVIGSSLPPDGCGIGGHDAFDKALVVPTAAVDAVSLEVLIASATVGIEEDAAVAAVTGVAMAVTNGGSPSHVVVVVAKPTFSYSGDYYC